MIVRVMQHALNARGDRGCSRLSACAREGDVPIASIVAPHRRGIGGRVIGETHLKDDAVEDAINRLFVRFDHINPPLTRI